MATLITEPPLFNSQDMNALNLLQFNYTTLIPQMVEHAKFNDSGYSLYDTISNIIGEENDIALAEGRPLFWTPEDEAQITAAINNLGNQLVDWMYNNPSHHRLLTANVFDYEEMFLHKQEVSVWVFQDDFSCLSLMYQARHDYPHLLFQQQYWSVYGDKIPPWAQDHSI